METERTRSLCVEFRTALEAASLHFKLMPLSNPLSNNIHAQQPAHFIFVNTHQMMAAHSDSS